MAKSTPLKLSEPFEYAGEKFETLILKSPTAFDISELGTNPKLGDLIRIGLKCAALPPTDATMRLIGAQDAIAISEKVSDFLASGQGTGDSSKS